MRGYSLISSHYFLPLTWGVKFTPLFFFVQKAHGKFDKSEIISPIEGKKLHLDGVKFTHNKTNYKTKDNIFVQRLDQSIKLWYGLIER